MTGYTKLFSSILMSSIWEEPTDSRIVWVTLLALADQHGHVDGTVKSLARVARVNVEACQQAIETFLGPDPDDRSGVMDGRRIVAVPGGWDVVNHDTYRQRMSEADKRERDRLRKQRARADCPRTSENVRDFQQQNRTEADQKQTRTETDADRAREPVQSLQEIQRREGVGTVEAMRIQAGRHNYDASPTIAAPMVFDALAALKILSDEYPPAKVTGGYRTQTAFIEALMAGGDDQARVFESMMLNLVSHKQGAQWAKDCGRFIPRLDRWLAEGLWLQRHEPADGRPPAAPDPTEAELAVMAAEREARIEAGRREVAAYEAKAAAELALPAGERLKRARMAQEARP